MIVVYAGSKFVVKVNGQPVILGSEIRFVPVGYRKGAKENGKVRLGKEVYEKAKEESRLVMFYGYLVKGSRMAEAVLVVNGKNQSLRRELINEYEEMIDRVEFPKEWVITPKGIVAKKEAKVSQRDIDRIYGDFRAFLRQRIS